MMISDRIDESGWLQMRLEFEGGVNLPAENTTGPRAESENK